MLHCVINLSTTQSKEAAFMIHHWQQSAVLLD
jgi:hypothetical protein